MSEWQKCPICKGIGVVSGGFYCHPGDCNTWVSAHAEEICRRCKGTGTIETPKEHVMSNTEKVREQILKAIQDAWEEDRFGTFGKFKDSATNRILDIPCLVELEEAQNFSKTLIRGKPLNCQQCWEAQLEQGWRKVKVKPNQDRWSVTRYEELA